MIEKNFYYYILDYLIISVIVKINNLLEKYKYIKNDYINVDGYEIIT